MHIGSHKAGSTSIQEFCRASPDRLREAGIHYPPGGLHRHHGQHSALKDLVQEDRMAELDAFLRGAVAAAQAQGCGTVLLSGEDLCALGPGLAHRFHRAASAVFAAIEIVLLLRNKRDYFYSSYKHHLLHGASTGEEAFVAGQAFSPRRTIAAWRQLKGVQLRVLGFDALKADLLGGFFGAVFGIKVDARLVANRSLDYLALQAVNALAKPGGGAVDRGALAVVLQARARHPRPAALPVEDVIADGLTRRFDDADWVVDEVPGLLERHAMARGAPDAAALCAEMAALYSALQTYFQSSLPAGADAPGSSPARLE